MTEQQILGEFLNVINKTNAHKDLDMKTSEYYNYTRPDRRNVKNMLYILYRAGKLEINGSTSEQEKNT
jgi:hypothetical protein